jgi:hypothetical protein
VRSAVLPSGVDASFSCSFSFGVRWQDAKASLPVSLDVNRPDEPDLRSGQKPALLNGTVTVTELSAGAQYVLYRWDSVGAAFDYTQAAQHAFTATDRTYV